MQIPVKVIRLECGCGAVDRVNSVIRKIDEQSYQNFIFWQLDLVNPLKTFIFLVSQIPLLG